MKTASALFWTLLFLSALNVEGVSAYCAEVVPFPVLYIVPAIMWGVYVASYRAGGVRMGRGGGRKLTEIRRHV